MLHLYRIYQLEEVIHENLRPEKSQEIQKVGGKRKSYDVNANSGTPVDDRPATKNPRRKKTKEGAVEPTELVSVEVGIDVNEVGGPPLPKAEGSSLPTSGPDGDAEERGPGLVSSRRGRRKRELGTESGETGVARVVRKRKKLATEGERIDDDAKTSQAKQLRKRRRKVDS